MIVQISKFEELKFEWSADDQAGFKKAKHELMDIYGKDIEYSTLLFTPKIKNGLHIHEWTVKVFLNIIYTRDNKIGR